MRSLAAGPKQSTSGSRKTRQLSCARMPLPDWVTTARRQLDRYLFPEAEPGPPCLSLSRLQSALLVTILLALAVLLQLVRIGWTGSLNTLWAEDGSILLREALTSGFVEAVFADYAGYLILVPRLIGEAVSPLPLRDVPAGFSILSSLVVAGCGFVIFRASAGHIANPYLRGLLAGLTVLTPIGGTESIASASYTLWYMLVATFWLLLWRPPTSTGAGLATVFIVLTGLSTPVVWFFAPLAILRALVIRNGRDRAIVMGYFASAAGQLLAVLTSSNEQVQPEWTVNIGAVLLQRIVDGTAFGLRLGGEMWAVLGWPFLLALTIASVAALALGLWRTTPSVRYLAALAIPIALGMFVISLYQRGVANPMLWAADAWNGHGGRYAIVPVMLLVSVVLAMVDRSWLGRSWHDRRTWAGAGMIAILLISAVVSLPAGNLEGRGTPPWSASVEKAEGTCATEPDEGVIFDISPPGFVLELPCSTVLAASDAEPRR